ncbi:unnamed protein product [Fusarium venenatum]|uniref:Uncharacterized protein n=1 Tax=Fusarium venenatum TaxID=56646 RepID=A0A2L2T4N7_9HYPO|nr:uncharacterized protein FVRRES_01260 [Fusarium venenatum]CEI64748.1 unnamed protein product [Fusarium venenatum]
MSASRQREPLPKEPSTNPSEAHVVSAVKTNDQKPTSKSHKHQRECLCKMPRAHGPKCNSPQVYQCLRVKRILKAHYPTMEF